MSRNKMELISAINTTIKKISEVDTFRSYKKMFMNLKIAFLLEILLNVSLYFLIMNWNLEEKNLFQFFVLCEKITNLVNWILKKNSLKKWKMN